MFVLSERIINMVCVFFSNFTYGVIRTLFKYIYINFHYCKRTHSLQTKQSMFEQKYKFLKCVRNLN